MELKIRLKGQNIDLILTKKTAAVPKKNWVDAYHYNIVLHDTFNKIGHCDARIGFNANIYYGGNVGYFIDENFRGHGYAKEAVEILKQVFIAHNINKIYITNDPSNHASIRVCQKLSAHFIECAKIPSTDPQFKEGAIYRNIWELTF